MTTSPNRGPADAVEGLYAVFARYPRPDRVVGCPCCVGGAREAQVLARPLRELTGEDLGFYAFKAVTTFGTVEDLKYFLPRLCELISEGARLGALDLDVFTRKLEFAGLWSWPPDEVEAVQSWTAHLWRRVLEAGEYVASTRHVLAAAKALRVDTHGWLDVWLTTDGEFGQRELIDAIWECAERSHVGAEADSTVIAELVRAGPRVRAAVERYATHDAAHAARTLELLQFPPFDASA